MASIPSRGDFEGNDEGDIVQHMILLLNILQMRVMVLVLLDGDFDS